MMMKMRILVCACAIGGLMALIASGPVGLASKELDCVEDWSKAGPIVREHSLVAPKTVLKLAKGKVPGKLLRMSLCSKKGQYVYRLLIYGKSGKLKNLTVDAEKPFKE